MKIQIRSPKTIKRLGLSLAVGIAVAGTIAPITSTSAFAASSLGNEMNQMFGSMSNVTDPGSYKTSRRGVLSAGSITVRNKIVNSSIVSFTPPSWGASCGGLDFYGGSFSFINAEQFVQLGRTIASNAVGYAFHLALEAMSPQVRQIIQTMQDVVNKLNQHLGDSCQMAQGIVNNATSSFELKGRTDASLKRALHDGFEYFSDAWVIDKSSNTENLTAEEKKTIVGNITWKAMIAAGTKDWTSYGNTSLLEVMMTLTGGYVLQDDQDTADGLGKSQTNIPLAGYGETLTLRDFMNGLPEARVYKCNNTELCDAPKIESIGELKGFKQMFQEHMTDPDGILSRIESGQDLTTQQQQFLGAMPHGFGGMIFRLSRHHMARMFVQEAGEGIALEMGYELVRQFQHAVLASMAKAKGSSHVQETIEIINKSIQRAQNDYIALSEQTLKMSGIIEKYNSLLTAADKSPPQVPGFTGLGSRVTE